MSALKFKALLADTDDKHRFLIQIIGALSQHIDLPLQTTKDGEPAAKNYAAGHALASAA